MRLEEFTMKTKQTLAKLRRHFGLAQFDVAEEMGVSQSRYSQYESGRRRSEEFEEEAKAAIRRLIEKKEESQ
jgi:predicted transcriptional regulator